jgi:hypothetical protein
MEEEFIEEEGPFEEEQQAEESSDEELENMSEKGFEQGYEEESVGKKKAVLDEDEEITD